MEKINSLLARADEYSQMGRHAEAIPLGEAALEIAQKTFGVEHPIVATTLNNLAELYRTIGDYVKAEPLFKRSLDIYEKVFGPVDPNVATILNNLAEFYTTLGDYAKAEALYKRSLDIREKALGRDHPDVATSLNSLAGLHYSLGDYVRAEPLFKRSLDIYENVLGPDHPDVATSLNNLAGLHLDLGDYAKAEPLYQRSLDIRKRTLGTDHPDVAISLGSLARLHTTWGDSRKGHDFLQKALAIDEKLIDYVMGFTSERQKLAFLGKIDGAIKGFLTLISLNLDKDTAFRRDALDVWLKRKGMILEAQTRSHENLAYSQDPDSARTFQELTSVRKQFSNLVYSGPAKSKREIFRNKIPELEERKERLEATLSRLNHAFASQKKIAKADCRVVASALPKNTALLELARTEIFNFNARGNEKKWLPAHYLAFILHAGNAEGVKMIDLGEADEIETAITQLKEEIGNVTNVERLRNASQEIYTRVIAPLRNELGDVKDIFVSPDGSLNLIPFEILQDPDGKYLIEDYTFNYLAAGRDILGFGENKGGGSKALLMGDPDFDMALEEKDSALAKLALREPRTPQSTGTRSSDMTEPFKKLEKAKEEMEAILNILGKDKCDMFSGKEALEEILFSSDAPRILHLATHGFFLPDIDLSPLRDKGMHRSLSFESISPEGFASLIKFENPLLRSGIALAGANNALISGETDKSDGIVTAEKILGLRLRGTDMVVLSACETGLGDVKNGEGVYGLRRAFTQAGAKSLVMSLWKVPDEETKELMVSFYKNIQSGMNRSQALRQAALDEMRIVKSRYGTTHPFFWGGFVFMGEP